VNWSDIGPNVNARVAAIFLDHHDRVDRRDQSPICVDPAQESGFSVTPIDPLRPSAIQLIGIAEILW